MWIAIAVFALGQQDSSSIGYAARFRLWDATGKSVAIVAYQETSPGAKPDNAGLPVGFSVHQSDIDNRLATDTTWTEPPGATSGYLLLATRDSLRTWTVLAVTADGHLLVRAHGTQRAWDGVETVMSDLLVASSARAMPWPVGSDTLLVPRSDSVKQSDSVHVGYQIHGANRRGTARTTLTVTDISNAKRGKVVLRLAWNSSLNGPVTTVDRIIDVTALRPGRYELTLQSQDISGAGTTVRTADVTVIK
jgi:hypothetical protein